LARDPYSELGVSRSASPEDVRKAFRKLAKKYHPDANPGDAAAEERFKQVSAAFDIVGDPEKRRRFDGGEIDGDGRESAFAGFENSPFSGAQGRGAGFEGLDLNDIFSEMFQSRGGRASAGGGGGAGPGFGNFQSRGRDIKARLEVDLEETISGAKKRVSFSDGRTVEVSIPQGAKEGRVLRLKGQGVPGRSGPAGDALIEISVRTHSIFKVDGDNLVMDLPVSVPDAVLGGKVKAPTPEGLVTLNVPIGSNAGQTLRLKGKGLYDASGNRGDLLARLVITLPAALDSKLEAFCSEWRRDRPYTPKLK
jgi:DnaJ-class molecular chaperone